MILCECISDINESLKMLENFNNVKHMARSNSYQGNRRIITRKNLFDIFFFFHNEQTEFLDKFFL